MERKIVFVTLALFLGVVIGSSISYSINQSRMEERNYSNEVEQGIEENMSNGFVNCYPPGVIKVNLSEDVAEKSNVKTICRKKVGDKIQTFAFAASN